MTWFSGREVGRCGWRQEGEGGETVRSALVVASHTPRGHPVAIPGSALVAEGTGFERMFGCHAWRW